MPDAIDDILTEMFGPPGPYSPLQGEEAVLAKRMAQLTKEELTECLHHYLLLQMSGSFTREEAKAEYDREITALLDAKDAQR